jgi:citronellol/citronellal dehydrogenase
MTAAPGIADARLDTAALSLAVGLFRSRTVLVSGGGSGIGKAIAWMFGRLGASVALCGRSADRLAPVEAAMKARGWPVLACPTDIRDEISVAALFNRVDQQFGAIDILINNAGGQYPQAAIDVKPKGWRAVVETNLTGTWQMMQVAAQRWVAAHRGGTIINITAANVRGMPGIIHSSAARAGVVNASRTAAVEWAPHGIRINCVAPGLIDSGGLSAYSDSARAGFYRANPQRALGDPWDVAQLVGFLASDTAKFITGTTVEIDGGGSLWGDLWTIERPAEFGDESRLSREP